MKESFKTRLWRWGFNLFPAYRRTGGRVTYISSDLREVRVTVPLNWKTRNYVGTIYGGSMYGAVDPVYMMMLIKILGPDYIVWDKAAAIRFIKPGRGTLYGVFRLDAAEIEHIRAELSNKQKIDRIYRVDLTDEDGEIHASFEKTLNIRRRLNETNRDA